MNIQTLKMLISETQAKQARLAVVISVTRSAWLAYVGPIAGIADIETKHTKAVRDYDHCVKRLKLLFALLDIAQKRKTKQVLCFIATAEKNRLSMLNKAAYNGNVIARQAIREQLPIVGNACRLAK